MSELLIEFLGGTKVGEQIYMDAEDLASLESFLQRLRLDEPIFINIVLRQGNELTVGIGATRSCVQYSGKEHEPPYLIAQETTALDEDLEIEFDAGGTITPVLISQTIPSDVAIGLILEIVSTEALPPYVEWVEI
jgi:hypothetical protein